MSENKYSLTLREAEEKYKDDGLTVKVLRRLIKQKLINFRKSKNQYFVSGHDIKRYLENKNSDTEQDSNDAFSVQDRDRIKVLNDVENLRTKRLKNENIVKEIVEDQKNLFFQEMNTILAGIAGIPSKLVFSTEQKKKWNEWIDEVTRKVDLKSEEISSLKTWRKIVDSCEPTQGDV